MKYTLTERIERAQKLHKEGYNCAQCVAMAFDDVHGMDAGTVARFTVALGGGVGGLQQICGAVSAMSIVNGADKYVAPADKARVYGETRDLCAQFNDLNGSLICKELKGVRKPCMMLIEDAITLLDNHINAKNQ